MHSKYIIFIASLLLIRCFPAQEPGHVDFCDYSGNTTVKLHDLCIKYEYSPPEESEKIIDEIMSRLSLSPNFIVKDCPNIANACALIDRTDNAVDTVRYILVNHEFLKRINLNAKTDWAAVSVLAHEIAHHLNGHTLSDKGSQPNKELACDEFSGFVLKTLGASLEESLAGMVSMPQSAGSVTHPSTKKRISAIEKGWRNADLVQVKYKALNEKADYSSIAKKWFHRAFHINGNSREEIIEKIACYTKAIEYKHDFSVAYRNRAKYYNELKLYKQALTDAHSAIQNNPGLWAAYSEKGLAYLGLGESRQAITLFTTAIDNKPVEDPYDFLARGTAYLTLRNYEASANDLLKALELKPGWKIATDRLQEVNFHSH